MKIFHLTFTLTFSAKLSKSLYFLSKVKNILPSSALRNLYFSLIHSNLIYGLNIFSCTTSKNLEKIAKIQKRAVRIISHAKFNSSTKPLFLRHSILPLKSLITFQRSSLMHSIFYKYAPSTLIEAFPLQPPNPFHDLRNTNCFTIPRPNTEFFKKMPPFAFTTEWNSLEEAKLNNNRVTFQKALKYNLLNSESV